MRTPKRVTEYAWCPIKAIYTGTEFLPTLSAKERSRWKRKNRTARLKDKIARLTKQNKYLLAELMKTNEYYFNALQALAKKNGY